MREDAEHGWRPQYRGRKYVTAKLPDKLQDWSHGCEASYTEDGAGLQRLLKRIDTLNRKQAWQWPKRKLFFFSDLHGDAEAFADSLVASGGVRKTGRRPADFKLTAEGRRARFIIGGDCFDKGPSTLQLLRTIARLKQRGGKLQVLAGNHDVRVLLGMLAVDAEKRLENEHFFIRTGQKIIPLLQEMRQQYVSKSDLQGLPGKRTCRRRLLPSSRWFKAFPQAAEKLMSPQQLQREMQRIEKKMQRFERLCEENALSLQDVYAAVTAWKQQFLQPHGDFYWFFRDMKLAMRSGSLLFVHAGLDNYAAELLLHEGTRGLNRRFREALETQPYAFYYGPLCNMVRTKYRDVDHPFSARGARMVRKAGISAVIHGHRNLHNGQRLAMRKSLLNFECDTSVDRHTRHNEGLHGAGAGVTIVDPRGHILGISSDYPYAKLFRPKQTFKRLRRMINDGNIKVHA